MPLFKTIPINEIPGDLYLPASSESRAGVVTIHGGGWTSMDRSSLSGVAEFFCQQGLSVLNIDYRLAPTHRYPAGVDDCRRAICWLQRHSPRPLERLFVFGASAGGHYALLSGLSVPAGSIAGIISVSGITDTLIDQQQFPERYPLLLGHQPSHRDLEDLSPISFYTKDSPPILCTHCIHDTVVPCECTRRFVSQIQDRGGEISSYLYDEGRCHDGHAIWRPGSSPKRLYADIEEKITAFIRQFSA